MERTKIDPPRPIGDVIKDISVAVCAIEIAIIVFMLVMGNLTWLYAAVAIGFCALFMLFMMGFGELVNNTRIIKRLLEQNQNNAHKTFFDINI